MNLPHRNGLVLSGGASYGAYEVGVIKALAAGVRHMGNKPLNPSVIAGTSAGAFNAAMLTAYSADRLNPAVEQLEKVWLTGIAQTPDKCDGTVIRYRGNPLTVIDPACLAGDPTAPVRRLASDITFILSEGVRRAARFVQGETQVGQRLLDLVNVETIISGEPYRRLVTANVPLAGIRRAPISLRIVTTNWVNGEVRVFGNAEMTDDKGHEVILASSAIPGIFSTVEINGVPYADGGLVMNTPLRPAVEAGADVIHVVSVNPQVRMIGLPKLPSTIGEIYRTLAISLAAAINRDVEIAARINDGIRILENAEKGVYHPGLPMQSLILTLGGLARRPLQNVPYQQLTIHRYQLADPAESFLSWLDFSQERLQHLIQAGYTDTLNHDCRESGCILPV